MRLGELDSTKAQLSNYVTPIRRGAVADFVICLDEIVRCTKQRVVNRCQFEALSCWGMVYIIARAQ